MYGFIEKRMANILGIPHDQFTLNNGSVAALVEKRYFIRVFRSLLKLVERYHDPIGAEIINSDILGTKIILHKYYFDDNILDGLTDGPTKETVRYQRIKSEGVGEQRFLTDIFITDLQGIYLDEPMVNEDVVERVVRVTPVATTTTTTTTPAPENNESEAIVAPVVECELDVLQRMVSDFNLVRIATSDDEKHIALSMGDTNFLERDSIVNLLSKLNKSIIIGDNFTILDRLKNRNFVTNDKSCPYVIINLNPSKQNEFTRQVDDIESIAFGIIVEGLFVVKGTDVNKNINAISKNDEASRKDMIMKNRNSPYAKYDKIYKDNATNVVFAVQEKNLITLTFNASDNRQLYKIALHEIARRFNNSISYTELLKIDRDYQKIINQQNCEEYVKFVIENSQTVYKQLKKNYEEARTDYEDFLTKAMESGKLSSKYMEQMEAFNSSDQLTKIKEKSHEEYMSVLSIPKVKSIYIKDNCVHVYTDNLYALDERTKRMHDIGTFHIRIGMHSNIYDPSNTVVIKNTKHQIVAFSGDVMQAPHVFKDGHICHGSLSTGMANAYSKRDIYQLIYQLILFLQQANTDDTAGKYVNCWPEVSEELIKMQEKKEQFIEPVDFLEVKEDQQFNEVFAASIPV